MSIGKENTNFMTSGEIVKSRQKDIYAELYSKCIQLKLKSADGK